MTEHTAGTYASRPRDRDGKPDCRDQVVCARPSRLPAPREQVAALTVLVPMSEYRALSLWTAGPGSELTPQDVVHALLRRLLADPLLAADVSADLREGAQAAEVAAYVAW